MRWVSLAVGLCVIALAFAAATHVADTREGLIAEVITEFSALIGIVLILYGIFAGSIRAGGRTRTVRRPAAATPPVRSVRDLVQGVAGLVVALVLLTGIAVSAGIQWALLGGVLLVPMVAGSIYLCARFMTAPVRSWKLELKKPGGQGQV
jgi:hypothetical protein